MRYMPIRFACPSCHKSLTVTDDRAGAKGTCPACKAPFQVPPAAPASAPRSGPPHSLDTWDQVDGVIGGAVEVVDRRLTDREDAKVRANLTSYADSIPHHALRGLGKQIEITGVKEHRAYRLALDSLLEFRHTTRQTQPFAGHSLPAPTTDERNINVWGHSYPAYTEFDRTTREHPVEDSKSVAACAECGGKKTVGCEKCSGGGAVSCPTCGGDGTRLCPGCRGDRVIRVKVGTQQKAKRCGWCRGGRNLDGSVCLTCNGHGMVYEDEDTYQAVPCSCGTGLVRCLTCDGTKRVRCSSCSGTGRLQCGGCEGHGQVVSFLAVVRSFEPDSQTGHLSAPGVTDATVAGMVKPSDFSPFLALLATTAPPALALAHGPEPMKAWIGRAFAAARAKEAKDKRLVRQRLQVEVASVVEVEYESGGVGYTAWFVGKSLTIHAQVSPITDALKEMVKEAVRGWKKGDQKGATHLLREVMDMAEADAGCRRAYEQVRDTIPTDLESKAKWVRWKPFIIAGVVVAALFLLVGLVGIGYSVVRAKRGPVSPPGAFDPRGGNTTPGGRENLVLVEFRQSSITMAKGGTAKLRLSLIRLGGADGDVTVRFDAGRGLTVPSKVVVGRGQEELEIEVRAGDEAGVFVVKATVVPENSAPMPAECRVSVSPAGAGGIGPGGTPPPDPPEDGVEKEYAKRLLGRWEVMDGPVKGATITFRDDGKALLTRPVAKTPTPISSASFRVQKLIRRVDLVLETTDAKVIGDYPHYAMDFLADDELVLSETSSKGKGPFSGLAGRLKRIGVK